MGTFRFKRRFWSDLTLIYPIDHCGFIQKIIQILLMRLSMQYFCCRILILVRSIKLNLFISPVLGVDFCPFPSGYKYDICFNNIQSKLASSHSYCRSQLIQAIYLPLPPQQQEIQSGTHTVWVILKVCIRCLVLIVGLFPGVIIGHSNR